MTGGNVMGEAPPVHETHKTPEQRTAASVADVIRLSGLAALAAALLIMQAALLHPEESPAGFSSAMWVPTHFGLYLGLVLAQLGLVGIMLRQLRTFRWLGMIGFVVAFIGAGLTVMEGRDHMFSVPMLRLAGMVSDNPDHLPGLWSLILGAALFSIGHVLLGILTFRAGIFPRGAAGLMIVGAPILAFSPPIPIPAVGLLGSALYSATMGWMGSMMLTTRSEDGRPTPEHSTPR
jgi:hypothetical protein